MVDQVCTRKVSKEEGRWKIQAKRADTKLFRGVELTVSRNGPDLYLKAMSWMCVLRTSTASTLDNAWTSTDLLPLIHLSSANCNVHAVKNRANNYSGKYYKKQSRKIRQMCRKQNNNRKKVHSHWHVEDLKMSTKLW